MNIKNVIAFSLMALISVSCSLQQIVIPAETAERSTSLPTLARTPFAAPTLYPAVMVDFQRSTFDRGISIAVVNTGDVVAGNIKVWVCASQTSRHWQHDFQGITSLAIEFHGVTAEFEREEFYSARCFPTNKHKSSNSVQFRVGSLSSWQAVSLAVQWKPEIQTVERTYTGTVYLKTPANASYEGWQEYEIIADLIGKFADSMVDYLGSKGSIGDLYVQVVCDNCPAMEKSYSYYFSGEKAPLSECKLVETSNSFTKMSCHFSLVYYVPDHSPDLLPQNDDLYLLALDQVDNKDTLVEMTKEEFENSVP